MRLVVYAPPREHPPPHVHVLMPDCTVVVELPTEEGDPVLRSVSGGTTRDVALALALVAEHAERLAAAWQRLHG